MLLNDMYLLIDMSERSVIKLLLQMNTFFVHRQYESQFGILQSIDALFAENNADIKKLEGIAVVVGKGSFTSTRIAVTVSNSFAYALNIPVVSVLADSHEVLSDLFSSAAPGVYVSAKYSADPNIGKK